jgi:hypothetical protein
MPNIAGLICRFKGHDWQTRVIVPGKFAQATTQICARCGKGEREYHQALTICSHITETN